MMHLRCTLVLILKWNMSMERKKKAFYLITKNQKRKPLQHFFTVKIHVWSVELRLTSTQLV